MPRALFEDPYAAQAIDLLQQPAKARAAALQKISDAQSRAVEIGGNAQANATQQGGQAWAGAANQIGQAVGNIPGQIQQARMASLQQQNMQGQIADRAAQQQQRERENASVLAGEQAIKASIDPETGKIDHEKAADIWAKSGFPVAANAYRESIQKTQVTAQQLTEGQLKIAAAKKQMQEAAQNHLGELAIVGLDSLKNKTPVEARDYTLGLVANAAAHGVITEDDAKQFIMQSASAGPEQLSNLYQHFLDQAPVIKERALKDALTQSEIAKNTAAAAKSAQPQKAANAQSESFMLDGKPVKGAFVPDAQGGKYLYNGQDVTGRVTPIPPASTVINPTLLSDTKETVAGMRDGTLPPILPGRATKEYTALLAEAHRQGYDLAKAATDWAATQKHLSTMNGAQQLRLNQAINSLPEMLDKVDALASQWKGSRFPLLNKANLALAKGGAFGSDVASIANQLDAQIADVTADLGNVYMGGNSPTDHALGLAGKSLNGAWDEKVLHDMVKLAKTNVTIRLNSIKNTGVSGTSQGNPYGTQNTPATAPTGETWKRDASGKLVKQ